MPQTDPFPAGIEGFGPLYQRGHLSIENGVDIALGVDLQNCNVGVQVAPDGRIWVCINGESYLRFKPGPVDLGAAYAERVMDPLPGEDKVIPNA